MMFVLTLHCNYTVLPSHTRVVHAVYVVNGYREIMDKNDFGRPVPF